MSTPNRILIFYLEGNGFRSETYRLKVLLAPKITGFIMECYFPEYLKRSPDTINNTGNATIPQGTSVIWKLLTSNTDRVEFVFENKSKNSTSSLLNKSNGQMGDNFELSKVIRENLNYQVRSSNGDLGNFEILNYELEVIKDEFPKIFVNSDIDSIKRGPVHFLGQANDDHGISRIQVVAKNMDTGALSMKEIAIGFTDVEEFYYEFPGGLILEEGKSYEVYFEVFDNDEYNGIKKGVSRSFFYHNKTIDEVEREIMMEQEQDLNQLSRAKKGKRAYSRVIR